MFVLTLLAVGLVVLEAHASPVAPQHQADTNPASPPSEVYNWSGGWEPSFTIHQSCNSSLRPQLQGGLDDTIKLAQHAKDHLLRWGNQSEVKKKYFGTASTALPIGWYDRIVAADKASMVFRCDDPDGVCVAQPTWGGHWRGENGTTETVICPLSFHQRRQLSAVCNLGYTVAESKRNTYWATDLMHRVLHVPTISEGLVEHYAEDYAGVVELAKSEPAKSVFDSNTLQYFAIDVWAYDVAAPGVGCTGNIKADEAKPSSTPTAVSSSVPSSTKSSAAECHTHADGTEHCV